MNYDESAMILVVLSSIEQLAADWVNYLLTYNYEDVYYVFA